MSDEITPNTQTPQTEPQIEPIIEPVETVISSEPEIPTAEPEPTAQIPVSEPLEVETTKATEPEIQSEPITEPATEEVKAEIPESKTKESEAMKTETELEKEIFETKSEPEQPKVIPVIISKKNIARELLVKARNAIQSIKRKKFDKVMSLFLKKQKITNDEVEKFMHISDATATRYLSQLEKEGKIKQNGKTGKSVFYSKI